MKVNRVITAMFLFLVIAGCQSTPEIPHIVPKDFDNIIANTQDGTEYQNGEYIKSINIPPTVQEIFENRNKTIQVVVDAEVLFPEVTYLPIMRVSRRDFVSDEINAIIDELMHGQLYAWVDPERLDKDYIVENLSKEQIQNKIYVLEAALLKGRTKSNKDGITEVFTVNREEYTSWDEALKAQIELYTEALSLARDKTDNALPLNKADIIKDSVIKVMAFTNEHGYETFLAYNHDEILNMIAYSRFRTGYELFTGQYSEYPLPGVAYEETALSVEDAVDISDVMINRLGLSDFRVYSAKKVFGGGTRYNVFMDYLNSRKSIIQVEYVRKINDVVVTYTQEECAQVEDEYTVPWNYERLTIEIDDSGIIGFVWKSPYYVWPDAVIENPRLLAFDDILTKFESMISIKNEWLVGNAASIRINISEIRFGLMRIAEKNKPDSGLLFPVWDFFGDIRQYDSSGREVYSSTYFENIDRSFLTINAFDGSIINRSLGY